VLARIGQSGKGEVYLATDTHLGRHVATKVLPAAFAQDGERLARFEREAKTLADGGGPKRQICSTNEAFGGPDGRRLFMPAAIRFTRFS
jgi:serine/threonine protein kinase